MTMVGGVNLWHSSATISSKRTSRCYGGGFGMTRMRIIPVLLLAVLVLTLGACAPQPVSQPAPSPTAGELDKVMAAGAKEGTVTVYNVLGTQLNEALVQGMKKYGITVETIGG